MQDDPETFVALLPAASYLLVQLRETLYEGCWSRMRDDLTARLRDPDLDPLRAVRLEGDLIRLARLEAYERRHHVNLARILETCPTR